MNAKHYYLSVLLLLVATLGLRAQSKTVTLTEAGTLSNFISEAEQTTITDLTIKGPINSADILTIRAMANNLQVLNLLDANIVYSADSYYGTGSNTNHTQNDVVGDYMFYGMTELTKVTLPKGVWSIGTWYDDDPWSPDMTTIYSYPRRYNADCNAFARCVKLQEVVLPAGLLWIGSRTFEYCTHLTTINLPEGLEAIGAYAFNNCQSLERITLPVSLGVGKKISWSYLDDYKYFENNNGYFNRIFNGCTKLSSVSLAAGMKGLPRSIFYGCTALQSIDLPESLVYMYDAFSGCSNLKSLNIPSTVVGIGEFMGCSSLEELVIPDGVVSIVAGAFSGCSALKQVRLPANLNTLPTYAFQNCTSLTSIVIPDKVTDIAGSVFSGCTSLKSITFSPELGTIGESAFYGCTALEEVVLPSKLLTMDNSVFYGCTSLKKVVLPQSLFEIGYNLFRDCTQLATVNLPSMLMTIPSSTFYNCASLRSIDLPVGLQKIDESAFEGCQSLQQVTIPGGVQTISGSAFRNCGLREVVLGEGITTLASGSFSGCTKLEKVTFPASMKTISGFDRSGVRSIAFAEGATPEAIGEEAFYNCDSLRSVVLPNSITSIGRAAFYSCDSLRSATLPAGIKSIPTELFRYCNNLRSILVPEGVTEIGEQAFNNCHKLGTVSLPTTLTKIGSNAFSYSGIETIVIPEGVTTLYGSTFYDCDSLVSVTLPSTLTRITRRANEETTDMSYNPFQNCDRLAVIDASKSPLAELPDAAFNLPKLRQLDLSAATLTAIPASMCSDCDSLRVVNLPVGITSIGNQAFYSCDSLQLTSLPVGVETIGTSAFEYCSRLNMASLPASLKMLGDRAFSHASFSTFTMPVGVTSIGYATFQNVIFQDVLIPETVTSIGESAFSGAEVKGTLTINPASNLLLGSNAFNCRGSHRDASGNWYDFHLGTVNWNSTTIFPKDKFCQIDNLYLPEGGNTSSKQDIGYIFYNGITDSIAVAATYNNGRNYYEVKQPMKSRKVTYVKEFRVPSGFNEAAGWKTLVLPFTVTKITHTRGYGESLETVTLAPFGSKDLETEGVLPFWLYELGTDGNYKAATTIEANKAYLISMPNNDAYPSENNIEGDVMFAAEDATNGITLGVTEGALKPSTGTKFDLVPTYETVVHDLNVYTLNEDNTYYADDKTYPRGSVFVQDYEDVDPFQAYLVSKEAQAGTLNAVRYYAIGGGDGTITGIEDGPAMPDQATRAYSRGGVLYIQTNADRTIYIYNVKGQTVRIVNAHEGLNEVRGLEEGIYMLEGQKVVVK